MLKFFRNAIFGILIAFLPFIAAEFLLRLAYSDKVTNISRSEHEGSAYEFNEDYLVSLKPNVTETFLRNKENGGDVIRWSTNSDSFRGPALVRNNKGVRIIVYGDSNIQGEFSDYESTYVYKLEKYLELYGLNNVEVINAGVVGSGPDQNLIRFKKEADIYKPNLVIFNIFADNDFGDLIRNRLYHLDSNNLLRKTDFKRTIDECMVYKKTHRARDFLTRLLIFRAARKLVLVFKDDKKNDGPIVEKEKPVIMEILREEKLNQETINELLAISTEEYSVYKDSAPGRFSHCEDHYDIDLALDPDTESSKTKLKLMEAVLKEANNFAASKGIKVLIVIEPSRVDLKNDNEFLKRYPKYNNYNLTGEIQSMCKSSNHHCVDLFDVFMRNGAYTLFFKGDDNHWNDKGQDVAAKETALYIIGEMYHP